MKQNRRATVLHKLLLGSVVGASLACSSTRSATYDTPEAAMMCIAEVIGTDQQSIDHCVGKGAYELLDSGDVAADREDAEAIKQRIQEGVTFEDVGHEKKVALLGDEHWAFPIPLLHEDARWRFELVSAREEVLNRCIGGNELMTIATMREYVDAQREYIAEGRDGNPRAYARRLVSCDGKHDGLYWPSAVGEPESPFGPRVAGAACEEDTGDRGKRLPFHGYYFRTLYAQGESAPGGAKNYADDKGLMTGGFALIAWPAKYGKSGVMTFQVNRAGIVFQKNLGADTEKQAGQIHAYNPDNTWVATAD
jgi:Protein of unknown function (DUF2950)